MKRVVKIILIIIVIAFILIQFIRPSKNKGVEIAANEVTAVQPVPENVQQILKTSCYDCHSNNTNYPWYNYVQPTAWILANHIKHGKKDLNFSDFGSYPTRKQQSKLKAIADQIKEIGRASCRERV